ncbi:sperm-tail PG-rich repeat-containing protein 2 [Bufo gargarizans]|uniref:sperm-tail PG-rich repeat-containing protein 2 n=1 Tax=Bufo gargarizans TaxID=30331 RepID=UPI001CF5B100|nr:sperm-tail PG-rich repeat-containing protein 2 [Bufo gargarizans]XP_044131621.1 sperm-tail PG-rich repeat-containing protein 2 [Bufo gargarizans]
MYDRAPRSLVVTLGSTRENVGPGSYDPIIDKMHKPAGYAPFLSTASRDFAFNSPQTVSAAPGPGHYEIFNLKEKVKGGQTIQNKEKRFQESVACIPGPGAYDLQLGMDTDGAKRTSPKPQKIAKSHQKRQQNAGAPSIPGPGQAFGYEETADGSLVRQSPPAVDNTLGPAFYHPANAETYATQKYRGVHFAKYSGKRTEYENHNGPGPGEYDVDQESALHYENVNSKKEDKKKYEPFIPRYHEVIVLQEEKKGVPGPGKYEIKRNFDVSNRLTKSAEVPLPPFLSHSKRFLPVKSITPAPGTYNEQRTALEALKKTSSMAHTPFGQNAVRFTQGSSKQRFPGPGSYNIFSYGIANESLKKAHQESLNKAAFGSSASRALYISNKDAVWTPGPGHYVVKDRSEESYKHQKSSVFSSGTERLSTQIIAKDIPPPGSYNVSESYEKLHGKPRYRPPRTLQAKRKQGSFLSVVPRDFTVQNVFLVPGPGAYDPVKKPVVQTPSSVPREERFKDSKEITPGPGSYEMSPVFKDTVLKGTFNATLPNPLLSHVEIPLKIQAEKPLFSLSV